MPSPRRHFMFHCRACEARLMAPKEAFGLWVECPACRARQLAGVLLPSTLDDTLLIEPPHPPREGCEPLDARTTGRAAAA